MQLAEQTLKKLQSKGVNTNYLEHWEFTPADFKLSKDFVMVSAEELNECCKALMVVSIIYGDILRETKEDEEFSASCVMLTSRLLRRLEVEKRYETNN